MSLKLRMLMTYHGFKYIKDSISRIKDGQANNYAILQAAHRLEKGLCIRNPRKNWGYETALKLVKMLSVEVRNNPCDEKAITIGKAVLSAFIEAKEKTDEADKLQALKCEIISAKIELAISNEGGSMLIHKKDILVDSLYAERLFTTRHSVRDYDATPVDKAKLEKAVSLALRAPSACNRQASQIYVISYEDRIKAGASNDYNADKYLIITGNMGAFSLLELNDGIVRISRLCGYLS